MTVQSTSTKRFNRDAGMVTAETAMVLPTLFLVACLLVGALWIGTAQAKLQDSSRFIARSMSQGDSQNEAKRRLGPAAKGLNIAVSDAKDIVTVRVKHRVSVPTFPNLGVTLSSSSTAVKE